MKEIGKDITIITRDICNESGQKFDKKLKMSIFEAFSDADVQDEEGNNVNDNKLTGTEIENFFTSLGVELQQKFKNRYNDKVDIRNIIDNTQEYDSTGRKTSYDKDKYTQAIRLISADNIGDLFFNNGTATNSNDIFKQFLNPYYEQDENTNPRTRAEVAEDCEHIRKAMSEWCKNHSIDTKELDAVKINYFPTAEDYKDGEPKNSAEKVMMQYFDLMYNYNESTHFSEIMHRNVSDKMQDAINRKYNETIEHNEKTTSDNYNGALDSKAVEKMIKKTKKRLERPKIRENRKKGLQAWVDYAQTMLNDSGNGKIDKTATQVTGACWLLAELNALAHTTEGKDFLERNLLKDEEKHIFAVHLQQAEDRKLPIPNGDGIYVLTEKEVLEAQNSENGLTSGEGDVAAYALAIERYMKDSNIQATEEVDEHYINGYYIYGLFEMITGETAEDFDLTTCGIKYEEKTQEEIKTNPLDNFKELQKLAQEQSSAIVLGYQKEHSFSVVGAEGEYLLVQESNNLKFIYDKIFKLKDGFPPTYMITNDDYQKYFTGQCVFKWR